jgi:hypothetical protein
MRARPRAAVIMPRVAMNGAMWNLATRNVPVTSS